MSNSSDAQGLASGIIRQFEGLHLTSYIVPGEEHLQATIGWGHAIPLSQHPSKISKQQAIQWLADDVNNRYLSIKAKVSQPIWASFTAFELAATVSWAFNCKGWNQSDTFDYFVEGNKSEFIAATSLWVHGEDKKVMAGLVRRRACERHIFTRGSIEEVLALDWYTFLIALVNKNPDGHLAWAGVKLTWL